MSDLTRGSAGRQSALADLCANHGRLFFRLAVNILRDRHAAEDVCQQAFVNACRPGVGPDDEANLRAWVAKVVVNESLQVLRRRAREQRGRERYAEQRARAADERQPDKLAREEVLAALAELPEPNRVVVLLRIMQGLSGNDVKDLLGCSAAEVSRRLYAGMEQLRESLAVTQSGPARERAHGH